MAAVARATAARRLGRRRAVRRLGLRLAGLLRFPRRTRPAEDALPARRPDELRRRPVCGVERAARRRFRLDRHGPAGRSYKPDERNFAALTARLAADGVDEGSDPPRRPEPVPRPRARPAARLPLGLDRSPPRPGRRRRDPPADARPDATFPSMAAFAATAVPD